MRRGLAFGAVIAVACMAAAACSSFGSDPSAPADDAGVDAGIDQQDGAVVRSDAGEGADANGPPCDVSAAFVVSPVKGLDTADDEYDAVFFNDEVFFALGVNGETRLTHASFDDAGAHDLNPVDVPHGLSTPQYRARNPTLANQGKVIHYLERGNGETSGDRLWVAQRANPSVLNFVDGGPVFDVARNGEAVASAWFSKTSVWLAKGMTGQEDIFSAPIEDGGAIGALAPVVAVNTTKSETYPVVSGDEKTIFFSSDALASNNSKAGKNIWVAHMGATGTFDQAQQVAELSSDQDEVPTWLSPNGCRMLFARTTKGTSDGKRDVWLAVKPPLSP